LKKQGVAFSVVDLNCQFNPEYTFMSKSFNTELLKSELELDHEDIMELLQDFRKFIEEAMLKLKAAVAVEDMAASRSLVHSIKGSSGNLRITGVYTISRQMQEDIDLGKSDTLKNSFEKLNQAVQEFLVEFSQL